MFLKLLRGFSGYNQVMERAARLEAELDALRCSMDVPDDWIAEYEQARKSEDYQAAYEKTEPLVSVCIATYNRADLLVDRCLPSVLEQHYANLEVIVVGDCCTDHTVSRMAEISDSRVIFVNLPTRGTYPEKPEWRWMVAGTEPANRALRLARGDFITHIDDDDRYSAKRIGRLVEFARETRADLVWHPFWQETPGGKWRLNDAHRLANGYVTTSAIFYHRWFTRIPWDVHAYRYHEPGDFNRLRKFKYLGADARRYPEPLVWHYRERNQASA